jgi:tRNA G18 (ribose-2'-O)-methylase SpoU
LDLRDRIAGISETIPVYLCPTDRLASIVGFNLHRGCLALASRPADRVWRDIAQRSDFLLVLEAVADPDNVGGAFRNAAAFGAGGVLLGPTCCDPLYRKAIRTSMGSILRLPYARLGSWMKDLAALKGEGFMLVALTPRAHAIDLSSCARQQPRQKMALLVGGEGPGLTVEAESLADVCVRIPMRPEIDSLNLATATGIALHYLTASRLIPNAPL